MKKLFLSLIAAISVIEISFSQSIGIGTTTPNASFILEIKASNKGLLIPRTSTASRTAIVSPAKGLTVYDTTTNSFWYHNGTAWTQIGAAGTGWSLTGNSGTGFEALQSNLNGFGNTAIGVDADVSYSGWQNTTAIGYYATVDASDEVLVGNTSVTSIVGQVDWTTFSDGRYKKNIKKYVQGLAFIKILQPITYTVDINSLNEHYDKARKHDTSYARMKIGMKQSEDNAASIVHNGFIAQDVEKAAQTIGYNFSGVDKPTIAGGLYGLRYSEFVVPLVKAVQEQ